MNEEKIISLLERMTIALEQQSHIVPKQETDWKASKVFIWRAEKNLVAPVQNSSALPLELLKGIDHNADILIKNTQRFAEGKSANSALLWGARGTGKSSLVKSVHLGLCHEHPLYLVEISREDISSLPELIEFLRPEKNMRFILFCDDLSFGSDDSDYKSLKTVLDGGVQKKPNNVILYATSNRRHLMPRHMIDNERRTGIHPGEAVEEKVSLSDRFGLWLGFHPCNQETYLSMIDSYAKHFDIKIKQEDLHRTALEWSVTRGARSGRVAWQFIQSIRP